VHLDSAVLNGLPEVVGVQVVGVLDFYDGPLDGLALYEGHEYWFAAVPEWITGAQASEPRVLVLHEVTAEQAARVWGEHRQLTAFAQGEGDREAWARAWDSRTTYDDAPAVGWFYLPPTYVE
jgi:hypothetical protein